MQRYIQPKMLVSFNNTLEGVQRLQVQIQVARFWQNVLLVLRRETEFMQGSRVILVYAANWCKLWAALDYANKYKLGIKK